MYLIVKKDKKLSNTFAVYDYDENKIIKLNTEYMSKNRDLILNCDAVNNPDSLENKWAILRVGQGEALIGLDYDDDKNDFREIVVVDVKDIIVNSKYSLNNDFQYVTKGGMWGCHRLYRHLYSEELNKALYGNTAENNEQHEDSNIEDIVSFDEIVEEHIDENDIKEKDKNTVECDKDKIEEYSDDYKEESVLREYESENVETLESAGNDNYFVNSNEHIEESNVRYSSIDEYVRSEEYNKLYGINTSNTIENTECSMEDTYNNDKDNKFSCIDILRKLYGINTSNTIENTECSMDDTCNNDKDNKFSYIDILRMMYEDDRISMTMEDYKLLVVVRFKILKMNMDGTSYTSIVVIKESTERFILCIAEVKDKTVSITKLKEQNSEKIDENTLLNVENQFKRWDKKLKVR